MLFLLESLSFLSLFECVHCVVLLVDKLLVCVCVCVCVASSLRRLVEDLKRYEALTADLEAQKLRAIREKDSALAQYNAYDSVDIFFSDLSCLLHNSHNRGEKGKQMK